MGEKVKGCEKMASKIDWCELQIKTTREAEEVVNGVLYEMGISGVVIEEKRREDDEDSLEKSFMDSIRIKCYLPCDDFFDSKIEEIKTALAKLCEFGFYIDENDIEIKKLEENWLEAWKSFFKPKKIQNIVIKPTWENYQRQENGEVIIELDPEMAFGTGLHPTTEGCLKFIQMYMPEKARVLDLGAGSGILSIACAKLGAKKVYAYDISPEAYKVTKKNAEVNNVEEQLLVFKKDIVNESFFHEVDFALGNLNTKALLALFRKLGANIIPGEIFVASGIIVARRENIINEAAKNNFKVINEEAKKEWLTLVLKKE